MASLAQMTPIIFLQKREKKCDVWKVIAIYSNKKTDFDSKIHHRGGKLVYFWLANSWLHFSFQTVGLYTLWGLWSRNTYLSHKAFKSSTQLLSN